MNIPTHLKHKPIIAEEYNDEDAKFLSIGVAQWDNKDFSAKVMRKSYSSGNWSPQSEELALHRVIDLASLIVATLIRQKNNTPNDVSITYFKEEIVEETLLPLLLNYLNNNKIVLDLKLNELKILINQI